jgi:poly(3-hydroxybutyrate) depolymerase
MSRSALLVWACVGVACTAGEGEVVESDLPEPAPVTAPTGDCPDLSASGELRITSNGVERKFSVLLPSDPEPGMSMLFIWHGLTATNIDGTPSVNDPIPSMVNGLDLAELADQKNAVILVPEAEPISLLGMNVLLWGILDNEANDLALYDDLRSCVSAAHDVDLRRVSSWGFSGGGLWTSLLLMERADTLASAVAISGGVGLVIPVLGDRLAYRTPAVPIHTMLAAGGEGDVWPDPAFPIIVFESSTDNLQNGLVQDGNFVVRCSHGGGHTLPSWLWDRSVKWMFKHVYGAPSPYDTGEANVQEDCEVATF